MLTEIVSPSYENWSDFSTAFSALSFFSNSTKIEAAIGRCTRENYVRCENTAGKRTKLGTGHREIVSCARQHLGTKIPSYAGEQDGVAVVPEGVQTKTKQKIQMTEDAKLRYQQPDRLSFRVWGGHLIASPHRRDAI